MSVSKVNLSTPVDQLYMVGEWYAKKLAKLEINTVEDLLHHYPVRYEDYSLVATIEKLQPGEKATVRGQVVKFNSIYTRFGKRIQKGFLADATGQMEFIFFNQPYLTSVFKKGAFVSLSGTVEPDGYRRLLKSPEYELLQAQSLKLKAKSYMIHTGRLVPVYPETAGVSSKWLRSRIAPLLLKSGLVIIDWLPDIIKKEQRLVGLEEALKAIHFPDNLNRAEEARKRLGFDELFTLQLQGIQRRRDWRKTKTALPLKIQTDKINDFIGTLPFTLTGDQHKTVQDLKHDLSLEIPANRLIQGDVGAGKTVVAAIGIYIAFLNHCVSL